MPLNTYDRNYFMAKTALKFNNIIIRLLPLSLSHPKKIDQMVYVALFVQHGILRKYETRLITEKFP